MSMQGQSERSFAKVDGPIFDGRSFLRPLSRFFKKNLIRGQDKKFGPGFSRVDSRCGVCECMNDPVPDVFFDILLFCLEF